MLMLSVEDATTLRELLAESSDEDEEVRFDAKAFRRMLTYDKALSAAQRVWLRDVHDANLWCSKVRKSRIFWSRTARKIRFRHRRFCELAEKVRLRGEISNEPHERRRRRDGA